MINTINLTDEHAQWERLLFYERYYRRIQASYPGITIEAIEAALSEKYQSWPPSRPADEIERLIDGD